MADYKHLKRGDVGTVEGQIVEIVEVFNLESRDNPNIKIRLMSSNTNHWINAGLFERFENQDSARVLYAKRRF